MYTAPPQGATFSPSAVLTPQSATSYRLAVGTPEQLIGHLVRQGWQQEAPRSAYEFARLRCGRGLVVLYRSGTALIQGQAQFGHDALAELVEVAP